MQDSTTVDEYLQNVPDWQAQNLITFRQLIHDELPDVTEAIKWGVPVFLRGKQMIFAMSAFKEHTKYNFILNGALLNDEHHIFNNGLDSKKNRSLDLREGETVNPDQLRDLVKQAVALA